MRISAIILHSAAVLLSVPLLAQQAPPTLEKRATIGCESCGGSLQFADLRDVEITAAGDILVVDKDAPILRRFDRNGKPSWSGGRAGDGPGEYRVPIRGAMSSAGMQVVDMRARRLTSLGLAGEVVGTVQLKVFVAATAVRPGGTDVIVVSDDFRGKHPVYRWRAGETELAPFGTPIVDPNPERFKITIPSAAVAPNGTVALVTDDDVYRIDRFDIDGKSLPPIVRNIPRVKRTAEEEAGMRPSTTSVGGTAAPPPGTKPKATYTAPPPKPGEEGLKGHFGMNALRYDDQGRLWVRTARGDMKRTVFDLFAANGTFIGSVTVPHEVSVFAVSGSTLVTGGESEDGFPQLVLWTVRYR